MTQQAEVFPGEATVNEPFVDRVRGLANKQPVLLAVTLDVVD
jgi:hypothetical protein